MRSLPRVMDSASGCSWMGVGGFQAAFESNLPRLIGLQRRLSRLPRRVRPRDECRRRSHDAELPNPDTALARPSLSGSRLTIMIRAEHHYFDKRCKAGANPLLPHIDTRCSERDAASVGLCTSARGSLVQVEQETAISPPRHTNYQPFSAYKY